MPKTEKIIATPRYKVVARQLYRAKDYTTSKVLAAGCEMNVAKFRVSTQRAKEFMASMGYFMENKVNKEGPKDRVGYKLTDDIGAVRREAEKSVNRARSHIAQTIKLLAMLERSGRWDKLTLAGLRVSLLSSLSKIEDLDVSPEDWAEFAKHKPSFLDDIAFEPFIPPED